MGPVWPIVIVETLPNGELLHEIYIVPVGEPLVELILVGAVRSLDLPIELRCRRLDVNVFHAQVRDVPMEKSLELVATIGADRANPKRKLLHDIVDEVDGVGLRVATVDLECSNSRGVVDGRVLVARGPSSFS